VLAVTLLGLAMPKPPDNAVKFARGNEVFYAGDVYLSSHEDTVKLKDLGFRSLSFDSRSFGSVKYHAEWPHAVIDMPTPAYMNGMDYDVEAPADTADTSAAEPLEIPQQGNHIMRTGRQRESGHIWSEVSMRITTHPVPYDDKPDTIIAGKGYVRGTVFLASAADTADLAPFGFKGFALQKGSGKVYDASRVGGDVITCQGFRALWPIDVSVNMLPESVQGLEARRMHTAHGAVVIERKVRK